MKVSIRRIDDHGLVYTALMFTCPGCAEFGGAGVHLLPVNSPQKQPYWTWNGDLEAPTLSPSILTQQGEGQVCHAYLRDGVFWFLDDSTHSLAGTHVALPELPRWAA